MRLLDELIVSCDPGIDVLRELAASPNARRNIIHPPDFGRNGDALVALQVTTRSLLGAVAYETGGIEIEGRLRLLGTAPLGERRSLIDWNEQTTGSRAGELPGFLLVGQPPLSGMG